MSDLEKLPPSEKEVESGTSVSVHEGYDAPVNASGHRDQLDRQYGLLSICATALTIDNAWTALGGSVAYVCFPYISVLAVLKNSLHRIAVFNGGEGARRANVCNRLRD
ncbi:hypothetical protein PHLCEN_2v13546 [Hermanssonia centrifuga]|uniref:Uncharacterized protein n=1 Tax=Hermanssonia centrifuga TaxID=98765 RepID=A0A2R6NDZ1_9APHY|nr:hypothetical protein PHLCEN_2v13546 [Hermanssonia centrifuga]